MGRESHNFRRRQKLIEKHTGSSYEPKQRSSWGSGSSEAAWGSSQASWSGSKQGKRSSQVQKYVLSGRTKSKEEVAEERAAKRSASKRKLLINSAKELLGDDFVAPKPFVGRTAEAKSAPSAPAPRKKAAAKPPPKPAAKEKAKEVAQTTTPLPDAALARPVRPAEPSVPAASVAASPPVSVKKAKKKRSATEDTQPVAVKKKRKKAKDDAEENKTEGVAVVAKKKAAKGALKKSSAKTKADPSGIGIKKGGKKQAAQKDKPLSKKELRLRRQEERKTRIRFAYLVCPGSVTERASRQQLNDNERRLLGTGALSWRWLREEDFGDPHAGRPPKRPPQANPKGHRWALEGKCKELWWSKSGVRRLRSLDTALEEFAVWPACERRVELAKKLQSKGALRKRCGRFFKEVVASLVAAPPPSPAAAAVDKAGADGSSSVQPLLLEARRLCLRIVDEWRERAGEQPGDCSPKALERAWLQMLCCSVSEVATERACAGAATGRNAKGAGPLRSWLAALRTVVFARYCPLPDADTQLQLLDTTATAAGSRRGEEASSPSSAPSIVVLPLGAFTFWQVLLLTAAAKWLGSGALVVRRKASGPAEVVYRTATEPA
eukprot:TRINITY_DN50838_c0_g1_i1.p1 TRINITY_DN50838_c0_g1~~TRINITY_DN50838_c0_g1_i1.p1  ORF type:complete len:606 (+),score=173.63 TRINITY_DN50838_c0_g1_i1:104-1921(+)